MVHFGKTFISNQLNIYESELNAYSEIPDILEQTKFNLSYNKLSSIDFWIIGKFNLWNIDRKIQIITFNERIHNDSDIEWHRLKEFH